MYFSSSGLSANFNKLKALDNHFYTAIANVKHTIILGIIFKDNLGLF